MLIVSHQEFPQGCDNPVLSEDRPNPIDVLFHPTEKRWLTFSEIKDKWALSEMDVSEKECYQ